VDIGTVDAQTTVVAQSLEQEAAQNPDQTAQFVADQLAPLTARYGGEGQNEGDQTMEVDDSGQRSAAAKTLIMDTANTELQALAATPTAPSAAAALHGVIAQLGEMRGSPVHLSGSQQSALVTAQLAGTTYSPATLAADLTAAGASATASGVSAADGAQRAHLSGWAALGAGIGPFEALAVATAPTASGGYALGPGPTGQFLTSLLGG
jgi:hypothetical protein